MRTHTRTRARAHTHTSARIHARTHAHTHTHRRLNSQTRHITGDVWLTECGWLERDGTGVDERAGERDRQDEGREEETLLVVVVVVIVVVDRFYIALLSAVEQTHCACM